MNPTNLSREAKLVCAITLLTVPTIMYGGITLLGILAPAHAGAGGPLLDETQRALWRAGHAHAGVWVVLSLVMQMLIDAAKLTRPVMWLARISAPAAAVTVSGGFFGLAFLPQFRWLIYFGGLCLLMALLLTGIGLLRNLGTSSRLQAS